MYIYNIICAALHNYDHLSYVTYACMYVYMYVAMYACKSFIPQTSITKLFSLQYIRIHSNIILYIYNFISIFLIIMEPWVIYQEKYLHPLKSNILRVSLLWLWWQRWSFFYCLKKKSKMEK